LAKNNALSPEAIIAEIKQRKFAPIYFLQGEEPYYIDQIADAIEKYALNEADKGFNQTILYGKDADINSIITAAKRFPMMSDRQVVIVKEAQDIKDLEKEVKNKVGGKDIAFYPLEEYAKKPLASTILVFCYKYKTLDGRKSIAKSIDETSIIYTSKSLYDNQLPEWISKNIVARGFTANEKAIALLAEFVGNNLSRLNNEIDKILSNFKEKTQITDAHVHQFIGVSKEYNVFELQNALARKDILRCNKIVNYFAENTKEHPIQMTLASLFGYFSKLSLVKSARANTDLEIAKVLGIHPFIAKEYIVANKSFSDGKVLQIFSYLREADMRSKGFESNNTDEGEIMKELIFKVLH
jgi:DNA polymerase III subunit delta